MGIGEGLQVAVPFIYSGRGSVRCPVSLSGDNGFHAFFLLSLTMDLFAKKASSSSLRGHNGILCRLCWHALL